MSAEKPGPAPEKLAEKLEVTRAALKSSLRATLAAGCRDGLRADQVVALQEALVALGFLPPEVLR